MADSLYIKRGLTTGEDLGIPTWTWDHASAFSSMDVPYRSQPSHPPSVNFKRSRSAGDQMVAFFSLGRFKACCHCGQAYRLVDALRLPRCTHSEPILSPIHPVLQTSTPLTGSYFPVSQQLQGTAFESNQHHRWNIPHGQRFWVVGKMCGSTDGFNWHWKILQTGQ